MPAHAPVKPLSRLELTAWRGFLQAHAGLVRELDAELEREHGLPLTSYDVLVVLEGAPGHRLRMSDLAASVLLSLSGVTRLVDRLERQGLVRRERCEDDRRGFWCELTAQGVERLQTARPTHHAGVRARFLEGFTEAELHTLAGLWKRVAPGARA